MTDINAWRKKITHPTRSKTPIADDFEDRHSEHGSEHSTSRHRARPKLARYLSTYLAITAPQKSGELFTTNFWDNLGKPLEIEEKVDPYMVIQSISTMLVRNPNSPIPVAHNSGLMHLIENYRYLREDKEKLDDLLKETLDGFKEAEQRWSTDEGNFRSEIRRLELIIARGKQGMTELMRARQGSVIQRKSKAHKTPSEAQLETAYEFLSRDQIDQDMMREGQRVVLSRSKSPSNQMKALSRTLSTMNVHDDLPLGTPPDRRHEHSLSYWAEHNDRALSHTGGMWASHGGSALVAGQSDDPSDTYSTFSSIGDPLPDEEGDIILTIVDARHEGDDFVALRDLVVQIAQRHGMRVESVLPRLVDLLEGKNSIEPEHNPAEASLTRIQGPRGVDWSHERRLRHFRSQPQLSSDRTPRRHFSFDPGDDVTITALDQVAAELADLGRNVQSLSRSKIQTPEAGTPLSVDTTINNEARRPSKIPSPLQEHPLARTRRADSPSSILTLIRPDSPKRTYSDASSINSAATAVRHRTSKKSSSGISKGSGTSAHGTNKSGVQRLAEQTSTLRNSVALAAARAAGSGSGQGSGLDSGNSITGRFRQHSRNSSLSRLHGSQPQRGSLGRHGAGSVGN